MLVGDVNSREYIRRVSREVAYKYNSMSLCTYIVI